MTYLYSSLFLCKYASVYVCANFHTQWNKNGKKVLMNGYMITSKAKIIFLNLFFAPQAPGLVAPFVKY